MSSDYVGKVVLVTGAASGLGRATLLAAARAGASVFAVDRSEEALRSTIEIVERDGGTAALQVADLSHPHVCKEVVELAIGRFGRLDLLCNVAGIAKMHAVAEVTPDDWNQIISVNLAAPFFLAQAAMPHLISAEGAIVNVASSAGLQGQAYMVPYCASKAGLIGVTRAMAMEFMHAPVRINAIAPAGMNTPMAAPGYLTPPDGFDMGLVGRYSGLRDKAEPEAVADFILYVGSGRGRFLHGSCLSMDQGQTAG